MNLKELVNDEMKSSMKSGDKVRLQTFRSLRASILEFEKSGANREMNADDEMKILLSAVKKRKESVEQFTAGNRPELAASEQAELDIIQALLPKQLSEDDVLEIVKKLAVELGCSTKADFGKLMPAAAKELKGKADGKVVKSLVEKVLGVTA